MDYYVLFSTFIYNIFVKKCVDFNYQTKFLQKHYDQISAFFLLHTSIALVWFASSLNIKKKLFKYYLNCCFLSLIIYHLKITTYTILVKYAISEH
jgi:hypothetical protein